MTAPKMKIIGIILLCCGIGAVIAGVILPIEPLLPHYWRNFTIDQLMDILSARLDWYLLLRLLGYALGVLGIVLMRRSKNEENL